MKLQVWLYDNAITGIINLYRANQTATVDEAVSIIAVSTHVPCLAVCHILEKQVGAIEGMDKIKSRLEKFYDYTDIELERPKHE